jgi:ribosome-associated translation inhibitor RaiA
VFSSLATQADVVHEVGVGLARAEAADTSAAGDVFACIVSVRLRSGRHLNVAAHAQHPYEAIDRAARQLATVVDGRAEASRHQRTQEARVT